VPLGDAPRSAGGPPKAKRQRWSLPQGSLPPDAQLRIEDRKEATERFRRSMKERCTFSYATDPTGATFHRDEILPGPTRRRRVNARVASSINKLTNCRTNRFIDSENELVLVLLMLLLLLLLMLMLMLVLLPLLLLLLLDGHHNNQPANRSIQSNFESLLNSRGPARRGKIRGASSKAKRRPPKRGGRRQRTSAMPATTGRPLPSPNPISRSNSSRHAHPSVRCCGFFSC
jgi:hypothetical protein